ncbi:hypothetical protein L3X38_043759 [Prunus dulcis]|uniref:RNase H type-1 domain-containing protein n=1 Tax=Prunus dulcis TaxID=3755 RepID=A0AAD4UXN8_PRUDU|nr:hypothetical protein L3X38_043759 [Prunus dulcis]
MLARTPPDIGVLKLNVDGSHKGSTGSIGAGRVIRDHAGHWIVGYSTNLRHGQILEAELWGLFFGLKLAVDKHLYDVIVEMDSSTTVMLMHNTEMDSCHPTGGLLQRDRERSEPKSTIGLGPFSDNDTFWAASGSAIAVEIERRFLGHFGWF